MSDERVATPWGEVRLELRRVGNVSAVLVRTGEAADPEARDPRATVFGAKMLGIGRIVEIVAARPLDRLLPSRG